MKRKFSITDLKTFYYQKLSPLLLGLISGFSVFYFLFFFQAYGIQKGLSYSGHSYLFRCLSFGILTFGYLTVFETWLKPKCISRHLKYLTFWYLGLIFFGSQLTFILFNYFWNWQELNLEAYLYILKEYPLMLVIPVTFYLLFKHKIVSNNAKVSYFSFQSENGKDILKINLQQFLYANSSENYITIFYTSDGQNKQHLIRKALKSLEQELNNYSEIKRIHRSFLVNMRNIEAVKQFKKKVSIEIKGASIPVSKQYHSHFLDK